MKTAVIIFPGSNCDRDAQIALRNSFNHEPTMVWHGDTHMPHADLIVIPGGFSYGDYLRSGAMAAHSPIMQEVVARANSGVPTLGICNGFQVLTETGLLPGALMRNSKLKFACKDVWLRVENNTTLFTNLYKRNSTVSIPIAHHDGNYYADREILKRLNSENRVAFRYVDKNGNEVQESNPNGSIENIAGVYNERFNVLGLMPHPERAIDPLLGGTDGLPIFQSLVKGLAS